jgi:glycosyltransferase involved in cell wall biosynthesis
MDGEMLSRDAEGVDTAPSRPLRLAILSYRSAPNVGGQGVYVDYLSRALAGLGHEVDVISGPPYPDLAAPVRLIRLDSLDLYARPHNGHFALRPRHLMSAIDSYEYFGHLSGRFVEPYTFGERAFRHLRANRQHYDAVIDNQTLADGTLRIQERLGLPLITMIHHPITHDRRLAVAAARGWKHRWLARRWYSFLKMQMRVAPRLRHVTCPSQSARRDIVSEFGVDPARITPIPLGVDSSAFRPLGDVPRTPARLVTTASADTPLKGLPVLVEAFHSLLADFPELELTVIGRLRKGAAKDLIARLGLGHRIRFVHDLTREEMAREFNAATIAVTPSLYEGFGLPAAEAMACGTPVIVSDGGALPEVAGEAGLVVPRGDARALASAIAGLLGDPARHQAVARACLARARTVFDWSAIAPKYDGLIRRAMAPAC